MASQSNFDNQVFEQAKRKKRRHHAKEIKPSKTVEKFGEQLPARHGVRITVGPVIGKVTQTTALVLLEVDHIADVTIHLIADGVDKVTQTKRFLERVPQTFYLKNLTPGTSYNVAFR
jgi:hypothetical protein